MEEGGKKIARETVRKRIKVEHPVEECTGKKGEGENKGGGFRENHFEDSGNALGDERDKKPDYY